MPMHQDLTIYSIDDDNVPLAGYGTVDVDGSVLEATFSTDPAHPRPYLKHVIDLGESVIDFLQGGSTIDQLVLEITDFPRDIEDQNSGLFTFLLASATSGDNQLLGVRFRFREQNLSGVYEDVFDGVCGPITMPKLTTFRVQMRGPRERERKLKLFNIPTQTCIFPAVGPREGWGWQTEYDGTSGYVKVGEPAMPRIGGHLCSFVRDAFGIAGLGAFATFGDHPTIGKTNPPLIESSEYKELLQKFGQAYAVFDTGQSPKFRFKDITIEWSYTGLPGTYRTITTMEAGNNDSLRNVFWIETRRDRGVDSDYLNAIWVPFTLVGGVPNLDIPLSGEWVYVRVLSNALPSKEVPYFLEDRFGQVTKNAYDGVYTKPNTMIPVRYNTSRMATFVASTPFALGRIENVVEDARQWLQKEVYRIAGWAPAVRDGAIYPIKYELPDENEALTQLDDSNTISHDWKHGPDNVINQVIVKYKREIVPSALHFPGRQARENMRGRVVQFAVPQEQDVIIERDNLADNSQRRHGTQPQIFEPVTLRAIATSAEALKRVPSQEIGGLVALRLNEELLRRYTNGAQVVVVVCKRTAEVDALREGMWVIGAWSALPDYISRVRGMNRLLQVIAVQRVAPRKRGFILVDAGPHDQPIAKPAVGTLTENTDGSVNIPVTGVPVGGRAEVQFALGEAQPDANSGQWHTAGYLDANGTVRTLPYLWPARLVWARARGTQRGRRASAWTTPKSIRLAAKAILRNFRLAIITDPDSPNYGKPIVHWEALPTTHGIRVKYLVHAPGTSQPDIVSLTSTQDFDLNNVATTATLTTNLTGATNDLTFTARSAGAAGNGISVEYRNDGPSQPLSIELLHGTEIVVHLATNGAGAITSTAANISDALIPHAADDIVSFDWAPGNSPGTGVVTAMPRTFLSGGRDLNDITEGIIPVVLRQWQQISVQVIGYPGFSAGAVTGTPGEFSAERTLARVEDHYVKPSVGEIVTRDNEAFTGHLELEILDQQLTITVIEFRTRLGTSAEWGDYVVDGSAPFATDVAMSPGETTAIGYRVFAYDHAGVERLFKSGTVEFPFEGIPSLLLRATPTTGPNEQDFAYFNVAAADPAPQGLDSITLTAILAAGDIPSIDPAALLTTGVGTGTPTNDLDTTDTVYVSVERPPFDTMTGNGTVVFRANAPNRTQAEIEVDIPIEVNTPVTFGSLSIARNSTSDQILNFSFSVTSGTPDHTQVFVFAPGYDSVFRALAINTNSDDVNNAYGWNLNNSGLESRDIKFKVVGYDASGDILGTSSESSIFTFAADADS